VPTLSDKQGGQWLAVALLVLGRTWVSDRIADLNGASQALTLIFMPLWVRDIVIVLFSVPV
jgi:hypothetical protein